MRSRIRSRLIRIARDNRGLAAVEFALILPLMVLLCFGSVEVSQAVALDRMVSLTAGTVANLVTQYTTISASQQMPDILNASAQVLAPNPVSKATVVVSSISIDSSGKATIAWSQTLNGTPRTVGSTITLPTSLDTPSTTLILSEVTYAYTPILDTLKIGTINLGSAVYMFPRASNVINLTS